LANALRESWKVVAQILDDGVQPFPAVPTPDNCDQQNDKMPQSAHAHGRIVAGLRQKNYRLMPYSSILRYSVARPMPNSLAAWGTLPLVRFRASPIRRRSQ